MMHEPRSHTGLRRDRGDGRPGKALLGQNPGKCSEDLAPPQLSVARSTHTLVVYPNYWQHATGMLEDSVAPALIRAWEAMANQFAGTETRHDIPLTALRCLEAGLSVAEARDVWCFEVSPVIVITPW